MSYQQNKFDEFVCLVQQHAVQEDVSFSPIKNFGTFKLTTTQERSLSVDQPVIWMVAQGEKTCYVRDQKYDYSAGNVLALFYPMPVEVETIEACPDKPFLAAGVAIDLGRIADVLARIDRIDMALAKPASIDPSGIFSIPMSDELLDSYIRLFKLMANPRDAAMLGDSAVDEVYYRLLCDERGGELRFLLQQRGEIRRISKAVQHIHENLEQSVSVEQLAQMVHMGQTAFYQNFRSVMHMSPLQYAKSVKLHKAQILIREGKNASEAGYLVGYNSHAQFSREYKRHFGFAPSAT
ncbi:MAG: AraC family transcriptional regulator [Chloroflexota bacterium]